MPELMRIVAGSRGGRRLKSPHGTRVRPTPDRVREALFSIIAARVEGARFLDLYAGTGAVGLEALSRGADFALFVEQSAAVRRIIHENVAALDFDARSRIAGGRLPGMLEHLEPGGAPFDILFADPPYRTSDTVRILNSENLCRLATADALFIVEVAKNEQPASELWHLQDRRAYGDTVLLFWERLQED